MIPLDPLVWRKDLDPAVKTKLYTFLMSYGRIGSPDEIKTAKEILANLIWSPFNPSSDNQLLPIRKLELTKEKLKVEADAKLSDDEKAKNVKEFEAKLADVEAMTKKAEADGFRTRVVAFIDADKAGNQDELKKMIAEFAANFASTN
jgi:phosphonate transport system substrate-binding protein